MTRYGLVWLLIGCPCWGQVINSGSPLANQGASASTITAPKAVAARQSQDDKDVPDAPLITIDGVCDNPPADHSANSNCKTVITQGQFEKVIGALDTRMTTKARREFAFTYAQALVMAKKAEEMGLDKGANYEEQMKVARIQVLSNELKKAIQEKVSHISDEDIEDYYRVNLTQFEKAEMERIYVPRIRQVPAASDKELSEANGQESERTMKDLADKLHTRAVAGEEFAKLQADAYQFAGIKSPAPDTSIAVRRVSLPPGQVSVMDLKPGQVSKVLADASAYIIYKIKSKDMLPMEQAREEIKATLRALRMEDEMRSIQDIATRTIDESYFVRSPQPQGVTKTGEPAKAGSKPDPNHPK